MGWLLKKVSNFSRVTETLGTPADWPVRATTQIF